MSARPVVLSISAAALVLATLTSTDAVSAPDGASLWLDKLVLRARAPSEGAAPSHRVALRGEIDLGAAPAYDLLTEDLVVTVAGTEVFALRGTDARPGLRETRPLRWRYRGPRETGRPRLRINLANGSFRLRVRGVDLGDVNAESDIDVSLDIGAETWCGVAEVEETARRIRLVRPSPPEPLPLADVAGVPLYVPDAQSETTVVRTSAEWTALWTRLNGTGAPPPVDFASEMVIAVVVGDRGASLEYTVRIDRVVARGEDVTVTYTETLDTRHPVLALAVTPKALVRVPLRTGRVQFDRRFRRVQ